MLDGLLRRGVMRTMERLEKLCGGKWASCPRACARSSPSSSCRPSPEARGLRGRELQASSLVPLEFLITFSTGGAALLAKAVIKPFAARMKGDPTSSR